MTMVGLSVLICLAMTVVCLAIILGRHDVVGLMVACFVVDAVVYGVIWLIKSEEKERDNRTLE